MGVNMNPQQMFKQLQVQIDAAEKAIRKEERDILDSYEKIIYNMQKQFQLTIKKMEQETIDITSSFELIRKLNLIGLNYQQIQSIELL